MVVDRDADVAVSVQIAWVLRARIGEGVLPPGARLPGLRELAEVTGVNVNTAKAVYQRLEQDGLVDSHQGTGTFVAAVAGPSGLGEVTALAAQEARDHGVSVRELAAALYVRPEPAAGSRARDSERRRSLRRQVTALEMAASELEAQHAISVPAARDYSAATVSTGPRLLGVGELEATRSILVRRLAAVQAAIDEKRDDGQPPSRGRPTRDAKATKPAKSQASKATRQTRRRPPRAGLAGA